jgi:hypothetical protein
MMQSLTEGSVRERAATGWWAGLLLVVSWLLVRSSAQAAEAPPSPRRSHIQPVSEMVRSRHRDDIPQPFGLQLSRAPEIVRRQLALNSGEGLVVDAVLNDSVAAQHGFLPHDVLVKLNDQLLVLPEQFSLLLEASMARLEDQSKAASHFAVTVLRGGQPLMIHLRQQAVAEPQRPTPPATNLTTAPLPPLPPSAGRHQSQSTPLLPQPASAMYPAGGMSLAEYKSEVAKPEAAELLREDSDFTIRLIHGDETRLVVDTVEGQRVFQGRIDSPTRLAAVPTVLRPRVDAMLEVLKTAAASRPTTIR